MGYLRNLESSFTRFMSQNDFLLVFVVESKRLAFLFFLLTFFADWKMSERKRNFIATTSQDTKYTVS